MFVVLFATYLWSVMMFHTSIAHYFPFLPWTSYISMDIVVPFCKTPQTILLCLFLIWFCWWHLAADRGLKFDSCWAVEVNPIAQGGLQRFTQWSWIEHLTFYREADTLPLSYCHPLSIISSLTAIYHECLIHLHVISSCVNFINLRFCS